jgi:hypothetical protein
MINLSDDQLLERVRALEFGRYVLDRCKIVGDCIDDCWLWKLGTTGEGYPATNTWTHGAGMPHRMLFEQLRGEPLDGRRQKLTNRCGNRLCCNPTHYELISARQLLVEQFRTGRRPSAMNRMAAIKGHMRRRGRKGSFEAAEQARQMLADGVSRKEIAAKFGISETTVCRWIAGISWRRARLFDGLVNA